MDLATVLGLTALAANVLDCSDILTAAFLMAKERFFGRPHCGSGWLALGPSYAKRQQLFR